MKLSLLIPFWGLASYIADTDVEENRALLVVALSFYSFSFGHLVMLLLGVL